MLSVSHMDGGRRNAKRSRRDDSSSSSDDDDGRADRRSKRPRRSPDRSSSPYDCDEDAEISLQYPNADLPSLLEAIAHVRSEWSGCRRRRTSFVVDPRHGGNPVVMVAAADVRTVVIAVCGVARRLAGTDGPWAADVMIDDGSRSMDRLVTRRSLLGGRAWRALELRGTPDETTVALVRLLTASRGRGPPRQSPAGPRRSHEPDAPRSSGRRSAVVTPSTVRSGTPARAAVPYSCPSPPSSTTSSRFDEDGDDF